MTEQLQRIVEALRDELQQYGELLALLDQQQDLIIQRAADGLMQIVAAVNQQGDIIKNAREHRQSAQADLARILGRPDETTFKELLPLLPTDYQLLIKALVDENNALLTRVQRRAQQNHMLLARSLELMRTFMNSLLSATRTDTYNDKGTVSSTTIASQSLYNQVG